MVLQNLVNDRQARNAIRDSLRTNLTDPLSQYKPESRTWIHCDEPLDSATYPRIQVSKRGGPTGSEILCIGQEFIEQREVILDIQIWVRSGFRWTNGDGDILKDEEFIAEYQEEIWEALKVDQSDLKSTYGITGLKMIEMDEPYLEPDSQLYTGTVSVRIWYFRQ